MNTFYNNVKYSLLAVGVVFLGSTTFAFQGGPSSPYYETLKDYSYVRPQLTSRTIRYSMYPVGNSDSSVKYTPSANTFLGVGLHLFDIDVGLNIPINGFSGKRNLDLQGQVITRKWGVEGMWQRYRQFRAPKNFGEPLLAHSLLTGYYIFNYRKYSQRAVTNQNESQIRSAGSVLLYSLVGRLKLDDSGGIVPASLAADFENLSDIDEYNHWMWAIMPGYSYSFVEYPFIVNGSVAGGLAHYWERYEDTSSTIKDVNFKPIYQFSAYLGVDIKNYFGGVRMEIKSFDSGSDLVRNNLFFYSVRVAVGLRFIEKGVLKKGISDIF